MTERPNAVLGWLVGSAVALTLAVGGGLAMLGLAGAAALAATIVGALTACVFFLAELDRISVSALALVGLALASTAGFAHTIWSYWRARRLLGALPLSPVDEAPLGQLAARVGVPLYVTPARRPAAFCFGLLRPRVVATSGLLERLSAEEQAAVLWHEAEHARNREPLKCLFARLAANTFFWIPMLRGLLDRFLLVKEIAADERAVARTGTAALAGALYEVANCSSPATVGAGELAAARIEHLFTAATPLPPLFRPWHFAGSAFGLLALLLVLVFPAEINVSEQMQLDSMLTSLSLHGLPGMAAGLAINALMFAGVAFALRRCSRRRVG
jgi:Zn-dependent protease with chaperone function